MRFSAGSPKTIEGGLVIKVTFSFVKKRNADFIAKFYSASNCESIIKYSKLESGDNNF
jgi:hypothetical protein